MGGQVGVSRQAYKQGEFELRVGHNVDRISRLQGVSREELSRRLKAAGRNVDGSAVTRMIRGQRRITVDEFVLLAQALGVLPLDLLSERPTCNTCGGRPPAGFTCEKCLTSGSGVTP